MHICTFFKMAMVPYSWPVKKTHYPVKNAHQYRMRETDTTMESEATYSYASYSYAASFATAPSGRGNPAAPTQESDKSTSHHGHALTSYSPRRACV